MLKTLISFLLIIIPFFGFSQKLKKIKKEIIENGNTYEEIYYVLKSDKTTKHGEYIKRTEKKKIIEQGYYNNGQKDSIWTYYNKRNTSQILSQGSYKMGTKQGVWNFYGDNDKVVQKFDFTEDTLLYDEGFSNSKESFYNPCIDTAVDVYSCLLPTPIGGSYIISYLMVQHLNYPPLAVENGYQGTVKISFTIDENGKGKDPVVYEKVNDLLDVEALRVVKIILNEVRWYTWGQKKQCKITMPLKFKLN